MSPIMYQGRKRACLSPQAGDLARYCLTWRVTWRLCCGKGGSGESDWVGEHELGCRERLYQWVTWDILLPEKAWGLRCTVGGRRYQARCTPRSRCLAGLLNAVRGPPTEVRQRAPVGNTTYTESLEAVLRTSSVPLHPTADPPVPMNLTEDKGVLTGSEGEMGGGCKAMRSKAPWRTPSRPDTCRTYHEPKACWIRWMSYEINGARLAKR
mmetsp:Transcript_18959/g.26254  ORF Transcript_18959/g.26254 Transcript_18959/m.26254 type:complete len:210 (-) Transcript_18959:305-934(-)